MELEFICKNFLSSPTEENGFKLVNYLRTNNLHNMAIIIGQYISSIYPHNTYIRAETAISAYWGNKHEISYELYSKNLSFINLTEQEAFNNRFNRHFSINSISNRYIYYNKDIVNKIVKNMKESPNLNLITFTITSCKRYDLFEKTINSFINCCTDIERINSWLCIDDNSSEEDRKKMESNYPFMTFYWKTKEEKGHPQSMNIIRNKVNTEYIFHIEDDWKFFVKRNYITDCLDILGTDSNIGQCLINKNYAETSECINIPGGIYKTTKTGLRYFIHEYADTDDKKKEFIKKHGNRGNCSYWPHFSFRPSLLRKSVLTKIGEYNEKISHFEMEYSYRYYSKGYISAFLEDIYCLHIGRLTSQRHDKSLLNAYVLNGEDQLEGKEKKRYDTLPSCIKVNLINLDKRDDRLTSFINKCPLDPTSYTRVSAIYGNSLIPTVQLQQIFENNDYNMKCGMVGVALTNIKLFIEHLTSLYDIYCIFEDDVTFTQDFSKKVEHVLNLAKNTEWDIIYLGHHSYTKAVDTNEMPVIEKYDAKRSLATSIGGCFGYLINKKGSNRLLEFINDKGMPNCIDTMQQKAADIMNIYYCHPQLVYSQCCTPTSFVDTDIQTNHLSLTIPYEKRIEIEKDFYKNVIYIDNREEVLAHLLDISSTVIFYTPSTSDGEIVSGKNNIRSYYIGKTLVIVINPTQYHLDNRYFDRLKKNGVWNIDDAICYK